MKASGIPLLNFTGHDLVAEILRSISIRTVVFGRAVLRAPWGLRVDLPGRAVFHVVLRGKCWVSVNSDKPLRLAYGDTVVFPCADAHDLSNQPSIPPRPITELLVKHPMTSDRRFCYGGEGAQTVLLCGAFQLDDPKLNLLGVLLPPFLYIKGKGNETSSQLGPLTKSIETELKVSRPGGQAIVARMTEAFLLQAIRDYVLSSTNGGHGLTAILRDECIGRVLRSIHQRPGYRWTVSSLAREANLSRSAFAARFKTRVGVTPQQYLQKHRLGKAIELLRTTDAKLFDIAHRVGYDSEPSFSKAFKRATGASPGSFRQMNP
jgi:AraC-like DNA-binding protein